MKTSSIFVTTAAAVLVSLSGISVVQAADIDDATIQQLAGEFSLSNGEIQTIAHHKTAKEYRVCVNKVRHAVPLKVMFDGKEDTVAVGNCADFEAMTIRISPAAKLDGDTVMIGKYHRLNAE